MSDNLEKIRQELYDAIDTYGLQSKQSIKISKKIDRKTNDILNNKTEIEDMVMKNAYDISYLNLKLYKMKYRKFPTVKQWNRYAKKHKYLNNESMKYVSGLNWKQLKNKIDEE